VWKKLYVLFKEVLMKFSFKSFLVLSALVLSSHAAHAVDECFRGCDEGEKNWSRLLCDDHGGVFLEGTCRIFIGGADCPLRNEGSMDYSCIFSGKIKNFTKELSRKEYAPETYNKKPFIKGEK
jgi:hypothetical protein